jgi:hypothetical protein
MKNLYLFVFILASPITMLAQNLHGLWSGTMVNDTLRVTQNFELALSEYRGKITGYTYQTYIIRDTFYYSVKRVKAERSDGFLVIEDVERIGDNFPDKAARKVRMTAKFPLLNDTTIDFLKGHWTTNQTKVYYSVGGDMKLTAQKDEKESDLLAHLQELRVNTDFAVYQKEEKKEEPVVKSTPRAKSQTNSKIAQSNNDIATNSKVLPHDKDVATNSKDTQNNKEVITNSKQPLQGGKSAIATVEVKSKEPPADAEKKEPKIVSNNNTANENKAPVQTATARQEPVNSNNHPQQNNVGNSSKGTTENKSDQIAISEQKKPIVQPVVEKKEVTTERAAEQKLINTVSIKPVTQNTESIVAKELPSIVAQRQNETIQSLYFKNDSLVLSLYDNGIVDGDTVSVYMNGENIISRQKLKEAATKKTIYISSNMDSVQLVLFAENLGSIPPNTGLLTVRDGDDVYQVRFSADLQKNASIILRRKKDQ